MNEKKYMVKMAQKRKVENKQIAGLVRWAQKYMDADSELITEIEQRKLCLTLEHETNFLFLYVDYNYNRIAVYKYDFNTSKWQAVKEQGWH